MSIVDQARDMVAAGVNAAMAFGGTIAGLAKTRLGGRVEMPGPDGLRPPHLWTRSPASSEKLTGHSWAESWTQEEV
jgi:hypothetical protein